MTAPTAELDASEVLRVRLRTPGLPCLVPAQVFDAYAWCEPTELEWWCPATGLRDTGYDAELPLRMAFVLREPFAPVPVELAKLHAGRGYGFTDAHWCLAPYGIDDATDALYEHRRPARTVFYLAADNLNALYWGLHDWAHFHHHGPFEEVAATEWQCDLHALVWLALNRELVGLAPARWELLRRDVLGTHRARCAARPPRVPLDEGLLADGPALWAFARSFE